MNTSLLGSIFTGLDHIPTQLGKGMQCFLAAFTQALITSGPNSGRECKAPWLQSHHIRPQIREGNARLLGCIYTGFRDPIREGNDRLRGN